MYISKYIGKIAVYFFPCLFLFAVCLSYYGIIIESSMHESENIFKEFISTSGNIFLTISIFFIGILIGKRSKWIKKTTTFYIQFVFEQSLHDWKNVYTILVFSYILRLNLNKIVSTGYDKPMCTARIYNLSSNIMWCESCRMRTFFTSKVKWS